MRMHDTQYELETRAAAALMTALSEVSTVKVKEIRRETGPEASLTVHVDVLGCRHVLTCAVHSDGQPHTLIPAIERLGAPVAQQSAGPMQIVVAPYLSPEAQALCTQKGMGFVDLEGNARLAMGEIFIVKRILPHRSQHRTASPTVWHPARREKIAPRPATPRATALPAIA